MSCAPMAMAMAAAARGAGCRRLDRARLRAVHGALTAGDIPTAGKLAEDALNDGIDHPMVLNLVAGRREEEGRLDEALALLRRALAAAPEAIGVMNAIGLCLSRLGRFEEAADVVRRGAGAGAAASRRRSPIGARPCWRWGARRRPARRSRRRRRVDPANLIALDGLAALALRRGEAAEARRLAEAVLAREPGWPGAVLTLAGADLAEGRREAAEAGAGRLARRCPADAGRPGAGHGPARRCAGRARPASGGVRGLAATRTRCRRSNHRAGLAGQPGTLALVRDLTAALAGRRVPAAWGHGGRSPAKRHVFLAGFPGAGAEALAAALAAHPEVVLLEGAETSDRRGAGLAGRRGARRRLLRPGGRRARALSRLLLAPGRGARHRPGRARCSSTSNTFQQLQAAADRPPLSRRAHAPRRPRPARRGARRLPRAACPCRRRPGRC